jgi:hypothetical protein
MGSSWEGLPMRCMLVTAIAAVTVMLPLQVAAEEARWRQTLNKDCLVWDALPQPDETVTWSGACVDGKASGHGTEVFRYRDEGVWKEERYVGEMQGGKLNGRGTLTYDNGDRYEGDFVEAKRVGHGTYTHANGDRYEGDFRDDRRTGRGMFTYHDGGRYEGDFVDGHFQGSGAFTYADGSRYEGEFRGGIPNGYGTYKASSGEMLTGNWSNGCFRQGDRVAAVGTTKAKCGFK